MSNYKVSITDKKEGCVELFTTYQMAAEYIGMNVKTLKRWESQSSMKKKGDYIICFSIGFNKLKRGDTSRFFKY